MTDTTTGGIRAVRTAFLVVQGEDGEWQAMPDINAPIKPDRQPTVIEMKTGCAEVVSDIEASKTSQMVVAQMMQITQQLQEQARAQDLQSRLKL